MKFIEVQQSFTQTTPSPSCPRHTLRLTLLESAPYSLAICLPLPHQALGIGILKGLFDWTAKYQRTWCGVNLETPLSDMREFFLRVGSDRFIFPGSGQSAGEGVYSKTRVLTPMSADTRSLCPVPTLTRHNGAKNLA